MHEAAPGAGDAADVDIRRLLAEPERLSLVVQPIVDLRRADTVGFEALSRFRLERPLGPDRVFAAAERQGLAAELEALVLGRAFALFDRLPDNCFLSVNVDPGKLASEPVRAMLAGRESIAGLVFELTEHNAIEDASAVTQAVDALKARGALVAMDDAGAGYSGLKQILELRPQLLKLDRALIAGIDEDAAKRALVAMIGELAGRLDAWLLAEGIETAAELRMLRQLGVPLGQGYFLARPAPPWPASSPEALAIVRGTPAHVRSPAIASRLLESCATCAAHEPWPEAKIAVRLAAGRPIALRTTEAGVSQERSEHQLLRVKRESAIADVAQRAVTRDSSSCWDPLVCVDDLGSFVGVIRMPILVSALAELARSNAARQS
jgi:EAL domain-containing protein (putative c-di-GMP-specific phosphodiesterase class I)